MTDLSLASPNAHSGTVLYSYWRSSCSWRVRIALNFKGIPYDYRPINLLTGGHKSPEFLELNPSGSVPALMIDNQVLVQSVAILEYLEERRPETWRLMPLEARERASVRTLVQMIVSDIQPVQNLRVLKLLESEGFSPVTTPDDKRRMKWGKHWITEGFVAVEKMLALTAGSYCHGNVITLADVCLVPQVYNARRFGVDMSQFPIIERVDAALSQLPPFQLAHPDKQPDAILA